MHEKASWEKGNGVKNNLPTQSIRTSWNNFICFPEGVIKHPLGSKEFFKEHHKIRYGAQPHILNLINTMNVRNKKLLEIGCGIGEDMVQFAKRGAICYGIDLTDNAVGLTRDNLEFHKLHAQLQVSNVSQLPYDDSFFDIVYSMGVLHHYPDIENSLSEIYRVLKEGGLAVIMLYNKNFFTYYVNLFIIRHILGLKFLSVSFEHTRNNLEYAGCPYTMLYSKEDCKRLFRAFSKVEFQVDYFGKGHLRALGNLMPQKLFTVLGKRIGFHLTVLATK